MKRFVLTQHALCRAQQRFGYTGNEAPKLVHAGLMRAQRISRSQRRQLLARSQYLGLRGGSMIYWAEPSDKRVYVTEEVEAGFFRLITCFQFSFKTRRVRRGRSYVSVPETAWTSEQFAESLGTRVPA